MATDHESEGIRDPINYSPLQMHSGLHFLRIRKKHGEDGGLTLSNSVSMLYRVRKRRAGYFHLVMPQACGNVHIARSRSQPIAVHISKVPWVRAICYFKRDPELISIDHMIRTK